MNRPTVSVVIPVYNGERFIEQAINSVRSQTHAETEIIVIDDGSTDRSADLLRVIPNIKLVQQSNTGVAGARNTGISIATGQYVAFLDQDDWWRPEKLRLQLEAFEADPRIGLVHTAVDHFDADSGLPLPPLDPNAKPANMIGNCRNELLLGNPIYNSSVMVDRQVFNRVGVCDAEIAGNTVADYELWLRIAKHFHLGFVAAPVTCYRLHDEQGILDRRAMLSAELKVLLNIQNEKAWMTRQEWRTRLSTLYDALAVAWCDYGDYGTARTYFAKALMVSKSARSLNRWLASQLPSKFLSRIRH